MTAQASMNLSGIEIKLQKTTESKVFSVDLDERSFLFPQTRALTQIRFVVREDGFLDMEFIYAHNESHAPPVATRLSGSDAREFCQRMVDAVYRAQSQSVISDTLRIAINVIANGYILLIEEAGTEKKLYLSTGIIWRFINAMFRAADLQTPPQGM